MKPAKLTTLCFLALLIGSVPAVAQEIEILEECRERLGSAADEQLIRDAYYFAYEHQSHMWEEIETDLQRKDREKCNYDNIATEFRSRFTAEMEKVTVICEGSICSNDRTRLGHCGIQAYEKWILPNRIRVCVENIRDTASGNQSGGVILGAPVFTFAEAATFAAMAGTIAHEVMHHADGWRGHGGAGSNPTNPVGPAMTVGVAMEHIALSPDLTPIIENVDISVVDDSYQITATIEMRNLNEYSGPCGTIPLSGKKRNETAVLSVFFGGLYEGWKHMCVHGGDAVRAQFTYHSSTLAELPDWYLDIQAVADSENEIWELSEDNNTATRSISLHSDLSIRNVQPTGYNIVPATSARPGWRSLEFEVRVTNLDFDIPTVPTTLILYYDHMWADPGILGRQEQEVRSLEPHESETFNFTVDVPLEGEFGLFNDDGTVTLDFVLDENRWVGDRDRSNNRWTMIIDDDYFRPDYQIAILDVEFESLPTGGPIEDLLYDQEIILSCLAYNAGPEPGRTTTRAKMSMQIGEEAEKSSPYTVTIRDLAPTEVITFELRQPWKLTVGQMRLTAEVDFAGRIDENRFVLNGDVVDGEANNYATTTEGLNLDQLATVLERGILTASPTPKQIENPYDITELFEYAELELYLDPRNWFEFWLGDIIVGPTYPDEPYGLDKIRTAVESALGREVTIPEFISLITDRTAPKRSERVGTMADIWVIYNQNNTQMRILKRP